MAAIARSIQGRGMSMERLSIDEVIEHCNRTCDMTERLAKARGHELESIESKQFWEHYQVRAWLKELKQYKDAEEQGLLLRLPCPIGSTVYAIADECEGDYYDCSHNCETCIYQNRYIEETTFNLEYLDEVGKYIFLTKAETEQALEKMTSIEKAKDNLAEEIAKLGLTDKADARDRIECVLKQMGE